MTGSPGSDPGDQLTCPRSTPARWRSGYAAACKAVYTGSIPVRASPPRSNTSKLSAKDSFDAFGVQGARHPVVRVANAKRLELSG